MRSLKALQAEKIDMWYLHGPDRTTPFEETLHEVDKLHKDGYFTRFAISNYMAWEVAQICELCDRHGWIMPSVYQGVYNALFRTVEPELFPCLRHYGMAFYNYNPLAGGYLTGRYHREDETGDMEKGSRFEPNSWQGKGHRARYWNEEFFDALDILRPVAQKHGLTEAECTLRWMTHHSMLKREYGDAVVIGASSTKHLEENLVDLEKGPLPDEVVQALDAGWEKTRATAGRYWHLNGLGLRGERKQSKLRKARRELELVLRPSMRGKSDSGWKVNLYTTSFGKLFQLDVFDPIQFWRSAVHQQKSSTP